MFSSLGDCSHHRNQLLGSDMRYFRSVRCKEKATFLSLKQLQEMRPLSMLLRGKGWDPSTCGSWLPPPLPLSLQLCWLPKSCCGHQQYPQIAVFLVISILALFLLYVPLAGSEGEFRNDLTCFPSYLFHLTKKEFQTTSSL